MPVNYKLVLTHGVLYQRQHYAKGGIDRWYWDYSIEPGISDASREPLYPLFLSLVYFVFGHSFFAVRAIQTMINATTCVIIYFIARQVFGEKSALLTAFIAAVFPAFIAYTGYILTEILFTFLLTLAIFTLIKAIKQTALRWYILSGFILGIGVLCKAAFIMFPFFIGLVILFFTRPDKKRIASVFCMVFVAFVTILALEPAQL